VISPDTLVFSSADMVAVVVQFARELLVKG
jgi:hypothetical protein